MSKEDLELREEYMNKLDEEIVKLLVKLGKKSGLPTEELGVESFTILLTVACRIGIEIGLRLEEQTEIYANFYDQLKIEDKNLDFIDEFENEKPNYILNKKKAN